jgi:hypothetical protein
MIPSKQLSCAALVSIAGLTALSDPAFAQQVYQGYSAVEVAPNTYGQTPVLFGVASYKICQIKSFLFAAVYVLGAIAFVLFAVRALFTKFEMKQFIPILGAIFIVASADLFIAWMSTEAFYCPSTMSAFSHG